MDDLALQGSFFAADGHRGSSGDLLRAKVEGLRREREISRKTLFS